VVVDPRRSETAEVADEHWFIRPGTDALLLAAMIRTIVTEGLAAPGVLAGKVEGLDSFQAAMAPFDPARVAKEHFEFEKVCARRMSGSAPAHTNNRSPDRRLRIGYVSPDFRRHSVNYFLEPILANHDHTQFEVFCYADELWPDATTERLKGLVDQWRNTAGMSFDGMARLIREDGIDVLIDLAGHTGYNRLPVFARKPAPVQITYLGYPDTTGLAAVDYRITDNVADPAEKTEALHSEKLIRLPTTAWCYRPPEESPDVHELPALSGNPVTFGTFNVLAKLNAVVLETWAKVLLATPGARLMLKNKSFRDPAIPRRLLQTFEKHGVAPERIVLLGPEEKYDNHLRLYHRLDVALDPFPYNGTTTTFEALWMGVPVVTLGGDVHVSRVGASLLGNVGLSRLVAQDSERYIEIAASLAADLPALNELRLGLRKRMQSGPLMDEAGFTRNIESAYRDAWKRWATSS